MLGGGVETDLPYVLGHLRAAVSLQENGAEDTLVVACVPGGRFSCRECDFNGTTITGREY